MAKKITVLHISDLHRITEANVDCLSASFNLNGIMNFVKSINEIVFEEIEFQVLKLYIPQGTPALYIEDIEGSGMGREELELILPRDATIKKLRSPYWDERFGFQIRGRFFDPFLIKGLKYPVRNKSH